MIDLKYIEPEQAEEIEKILKACLELYPNGYFKIYDTEEFICKTRNTDKILKDIDGGDEEINIYFWLENNYLGWFDILPYEQDGILCNYSANEFCENVYNKIYN